jgi:hypothetical protein
MALSLRNDDLPEVLARVVVAEGFDRVVEWKDPVDDRFQPVQADLLQALCSDFRVANQGRQHQLHVEDVDTRSFAVESFNRSRTASVTPQRFESLSNIFIISSLYLSCCL